MKNVLTIAGSDSSGGAGIQADLKTFSAHGVFGMSVITAVTAQNTQGVSAVQDILPEIILRQIEAVFEDIQVDAVKIGMASRIETIEAIAEGLKKYNPQIVVLDPVMVSKSGYHLLDPSAKDALIERLIPLATLVTPNIPEAEAIAGIRIRNPQDMEIAARKIFSMGPRQVLIKGGHLDDAAVDVLFDGTRFKRFTAQRLQMKNTHGTGCTLSSAIASNLARGDGIALAVEKAKSYVTNAIAHGFSIGKGVGPVHHFYELYQKAGCLNEYER